MKRVTAKQRIAQRQQRNRELAAEDAKHRCGFCKRDLPKTGVKMLWNSPDMFCSDDCLESATRVGR